MERLAPIILLSLAAVVLVGLIGSFAAREWAPMFQKPTPGSCAELAAKCRGREGRLWIDRMGVASCEFNRTEELR